MHAMHVHGQVGLHADSGGAISRDALKLYCCGIGGEVRFDRHGGIRGFGLGMLFFKFRRHVGGSHRCAVGVADAADDGQQHGGRGERDLIDVDEDGRGERDLIGV